MQINTIIGDPVEHSLSPFIHNYLYQKLSLESKYKFTKTHLPPENLETFLTEIKTKNSQQINGLTITIPHKVESLKQVNDLDPVAKKIGSINTIKIDRKGKMTGYNTDYLGTLIPLYETIKQGRGTDYRSADLKSYILKRLDNIAKTYYNATDYQLNLPNPSDYKDFLKGKSVLLLGAGGASRAMAYACLLAGASVYIANRTSERAKDLAQKLLSEGKIKAISLDQIDKYNFDLIINSTSVGLNQEVSPLDNEFLNSDQVVFDAVYSPLETLLLRQARAVGAKTISGIEMLIWQAIYQFEIQVLLSKIKSKLPVKSVDVAE